MLLSLSVGLRLSDINQNMCRVFCQVSTVDDEKASSTIVFPFAVWFSTDVLTTVDLYANFDEWLHQPDCKP